MAVMEKEETFLASSRAKILSLWLDLKLERIERDELTKRLDLLLNDLEANHPEIYQTILPDLANLRQQVISDQELKSY